MTVRKLIELLEGADPDATVLIRDEGMHLDIGVVERDVRVSFLGGIKYRLLRSDEPDDEKAVVIR